MKYLVGLLCPFLVLLLGLYLRFGAISPCGILFRIAYEDQRDDFSNPKPLHQRAYRFVAGCTPWECIHRVMNFGRTKCIFAHTDEVVAGKRKIEDLGGC